MPRVSVMPDVVAATSGRSSIVGVGRYGSRSEVQLREVEAFVEKARKRLVAHDVERVRLGARVRFQQHFRCTWERKCRTLSNW